jgi:hypothetical protein
MRKPRHYLNEKEENREIQNIPPELNELLSHFFLLGKQVRWHRI